MKRTTKAKKAGYVEYNPNNSGGHWWLTDDNWRALEAAGWKVQWASTGFAYTEKGANELDADGTPKLVPIEKVKSKYRMMMTDKDEAGVYRYLGALARYAYRTGLPLREAVAEWERVTGASSTEAGCSCCGVPHTFTEYDADGKHVASGPSASYSASW